HELSHPFLIKSGKRICVENIVRRFGMMKPASAAGHRLLVDIGAKAPCATVAAVHIEADELGRIVAREAERRLGKIICTKGKEFGFKSDLVGGDGGPGELNHGSYQVAELRL